MSAPSRRKGSTVSQQLQAVPSNYSFVQAVRLLERLTAFDPASNSNKHPLKMPINPVGNFTPPTSEIMRFRTHQTFTFPSSEIEEIQKNDESHQWEMLVNFMGLTGTMGVLPHHYTEMILKRFKLKDRTLANFLDIFNHRIISLFYKASIKYQLPLAVEQHKLMTSAALKNDAHSHMLLSLIGMGTEPLTKSLYIKHESLVFYAGLLSQKVRTSTSLKQILQHYFNIPVEIRQFEGQWQELIRDVRTQLPSKTTPFGQNVCLGRSAMLGKKGWFAQGKIRIILGPLNKEQMNKFAPGTRSLKALNELVRLYIGLEHDYDFTIRVRKKDVSHPVCLSKKNLPMLSWNTFLSTRPDNNYTQNDITDIALSVNRLI